MCFVSLPFGFANEYAYTGSAYISDEGAFDDIDGEEYYEPELEPADGEGDVGRRRGGEDGDDDDHDPAAAAASNGDHPTNIVASGDPNAAAAANKGGDRSQRDKKIPNDQRTTTPYMTKYEKARILGTRALQIRCVVFSRPLFWDLRKGRKD